MFVVYADDNRTRRNNPVVVPCLLALNIFGFLFQHIDFQRTLMAYAVVPYEISHRQDMVGKRQWTLEDGSKVEVEYHPAFLTPYLNLLLSMFMHGNFIHIGGNMLYLWIFGDQIEDRLGKTKFVVFYIISGLVAALAQIALYPNSQVPMVGASGAIAGVLGAYLLSYPRNTLYAYFYLMKITCPAWAFIGLWFVMQTIGPYTGTPGVAYMAHIGGFLAGAILLTLFLPLENSRKKRRPRVLSPRRR